MAEAVLFDDAKLVSDFEGFLRKIYYKELIEASNKDAILVIDFKNLDEYSSELSDLLLKKPKDFFALTEKSMGNIDLPIKVRVRVKGLPQAVSVRDLRAAHIDKFVSVEGVVRKASEIRPEILSTTWECSECGAITIEERKSGFIFSPKWCDCGNRKGFKQIEKNMVDTRWIVIEEPFELTEGERPSQVTIMMAEDLANRYGRRISDPGNRLKITGVLKDIPKAKMFSAKLDFFLDANFVEPTEIGWSKIELKEEDIEEIKKLSKDPKIYNMFVASLAPTLYGMKEIKEAIILQIFGGVHRKMVDGTKSRGDIHVLLVGDPAAGKCVSGDTKVILNTGEMRSIEEMVEKKMKDNKTEIDDGFYAKGNDDILSMSLEGKAEQKKANIFWKRESPRFLYKVKTAKGKEVIVTPTHPFFICDSGMISSKKASDIRKGYFIATPSKINVKGKRQEIRVYVRRRTNKHMKVPKYTSPEFCKFIAYVLAEGYIQKRKNTSLVWFTNSDKEILDDFERAASIFALKINKRRPHKGKGSYDYYISSVELVEFLEKLEPKMLSKSSGKKIPNLLLKCSDKEVKAFLQAFFDSEAHVEKSGIELTSASKEMLEQIQVMLLRFGVVSSLKSKWGHATNTKKPIKRKYHRIFISGTRLEKFREIGFVSKRKSLALERLGRKNSISDAVPNLSNLLKIIRKKAGISQFSMGLPRSTYQHFERGDRLPTKKSLDKIYKTLEKYDLTEIEILKQIKDSDIYWDKVTTVEKIKSNQKWVYDLQVPEFHNFIGNGIYVHNSQLLKLVPEIIPRGRYVSGKGASVKYDEPVIIRNSHEIKTVQFGDYVDKFYKNGGDGFTPPDKRIETLSLDMSTLKFKWKPIKSFFRHKVDDSLIKFELETGREVSVTDDHSIFTIEDGIIAAKKASSLKRGDVVIIPAMIPGSSNNLTVEEAKFLGYFIAEGHLHFEQNNYKIEFTFGKNENKIISNIEKISKNVFCKEAKIEPKGNAVRIVINGKDAFLKMQKLLGNAFGKKAKEKSIPNIIFNSSQECRNAFIDAYFAGDKGVTKSKRLASDLLYLYLQDGKIASLNKRDESGIRRIEDRLIKATGKRYDLKAPHPDKEFSNFYRNVPFSACPPLVRKYFLKKTMNSKYSRVNIRRVSNRMLLERLKFVGNRKIETSEVKKRFGKGMKDYISSKRHLFRLEGRGRNWFVSLAEEGINLLKEYERFEKICKSEMGFVRIKGITKEKGEEGYVYDFSVDGENFVSGFGGVLCHNTGAGLTASVTKDEQFMGGWVLEAGAMVLTHKGMLAVDEFEKMSTEDQVSMHEAMEQGTISIAKASIVATLPAQTSILAGGNPKFSRFDPYLPISKQITIPDTLLSRFDLKFILKDVADSERDRKVIDHIVSSREEGYEAAKPLFEREFIRKYIAYAKEHCKPEMTPDASKILKTFYINTRKQAEGGNAPMPITLRQFEALLRLSEASAKVQLSNVVREEDAQRAIRLMRFSLMEVGFDPETGQIDVDRSEGITSQSERSKIRIVLDLINELSKERREISMKDLNENAQKRGIENIDEFVEKLKREGLLFEPNPGYVQKV